eukprot:5722403-Alexandrium_andersonii.AAC.1
MAASCSMPLSVWSMLLPPSSGVAPRFAHHPEGRVLKLGDVSNVWESPRHAGDRSAIWRGLDWSLPHAAELAADPS